MVDTGAMGRVPRGHRWLLALAAAAMVAAGCAGSGYQYVKNSDDHAYFKVPDDWKLYDEDAILERLGSDLTERELERARELSWRVGFDGSPKPSLRHIVSELVTKHPAGEASVQELTFDDSDAASISFLRNFILPIDSAVEQSSAEIIEYEELELDGGFHGIRIVAEIKIPEGQDTTDFRPLTYSQVSLLDQGSNRVYNLFISCESTCYERNQDQIENVVESWTVRE
jgi:hypothetical protein